MYSIPLVAAWMSRKDQSATTRELAGLLLLLLPLSLCRGQLVPVSPHEILSRPASGPSVQATFILPPWMCALSHAFSFDIASFAFTPFVLWLKMLGGHFGVK